jgi:uncharacterized protein DUF3309
MNLNTVLLVVLIILLLGALPTWPYSAEWGTTRRAVWDCC